jgi:hypothetical protein
MVSQLEVHYHYQNASTIKITLLQQDDEPPDEELQPVKSKGGDLSIDTRRNITNEEINIGKKAYESAIAGHVELVKQQESAVATAFGKKYDLKTDFQLFEKKDSCL